jgi:hypothetical protein
LSAALAIDPGTVQGSVQLDGSTVRLTHAFAHLHDNAEGLVPRARQLRIVLADRDVPQDALAGIALQALKRLAREGKVRGLLLELDADQPRRGVLTLLQPSIATDQPFVMQEIAMAHNRVLGVLRYGEVSRFGAPVSSERRITADLSGKAALDSPQARALPSTQGLVRVVVRGNLATAIFADGRWLGLAGDASGWRPND